MQSATSAFGYHQEDNSRNCQIGACLTMPSKLGNFEMTELVKWVSGFRFAMLSPTLLDEGGPLDRKAMRRMNSINKHSIPLLSAVVHLTELLVRAVSKQNDTDSSRFVANTSELRIQSDDSAAASTD